MQQHDDLIARLGAEGAMPHRHRIRGFAAALAASGIAVASIGLWGFDLLGWPVRADYLIAISAAPVLAKQAVPLLILLTTVPAAIALGRPEASPRLWPVAASLLIFPVLFVLVLLATPVDGWGNLVLRPSFLRCLVSIPLLAMALVAAQIWSLRQDAVTRPWVAGGLAGLAAGGAAAVIYALICTEDSPGFYALWYLLGILASGVIGAGAGRIFLRW